MPRISLVSRRRVVARVAAAVAAVLAVVMVPAAASAATGSYTLNDWAGQSGLYTTWNWSFSPQLSAPETVPDDAVITGVSAGTTWSRNPVGGYYYEHAICLGSTSTCYIAASNTANSWAIPETPLGWASAFNAKTTKIIYGARMRQAGSPPAIRPPINPSAYLFSTHFITVYYSY